jgi:hypothetical protein
MRNGSKDVNMMTKDGIFLCVSKQKKSTSSQFSPCFFSVFDDVCLWCNPSRAHKCNKAIFIAVTSGADGAFDHTHQSAVTWIRKLSSQTKRIKIGRRHALTHSQRHTNTHTHKHFDWTIRTNFVSVVGCRNYNLGENSRMQIEFRSWKQNAIREG